MGEILDVSLQIGLNQISTHGILKNYNVILQVYDDECKEAKTIEMTGRILRDSNEGTNSIVPVLLGPICFGINWAGLIVDNSNFLSVADLNPSVFPFKYIYQLRPYAGVFQAVPSFIKAMGWKKVFFLSETLKLYERIEKSVSKGLKSLNITVAGTTQIIEPGVELPEIKFLENAVMELKQRDPRIIIVLTRNSISVACALYDAGLYGNKIVFLWEGVTMFQSNDPMKPEGCTEHKLASVLRSIIFISQATPMNLDPDHQGVLGMTPERFDSMMKAGLDDDKPEIRKSWFQWRATFYSQIVGLSLVLDKTEEKLQKMGSNLSEWLTDGDNYRQNASFITGLLSQEFKQFKYKGLNTYGDQVITRPVSKAGFHQMQQDDSSSDSAASFKAVPVAYYDGDTGEFSLMQEFKWRTKGNRKPVDSITQHNRNVALLPMATKYSVFSLSILLLFGSLLNLFILELRKSNSKSEYVSQTGFFNLLIAIGNMAVALFLILMTIVFAPEPLICSLSSVILIFGLWLASVCQIVKLKMSRTINNQFRMTRPKLKKDSKQRIEMEELNDASRMIIRARKKKWKIVAITLPLFLGLVAAIWLFAIDPMSVTKVAVHSVTLDNDRYDDFSHVCIPNARSGMIFLGIFGFSYALLLIKYIQCGFTSNTVATEVVAEIFFLRTAAYAIPSISFFGILTIILLFSSQIVTTMSASLVLILIVAIIKVALQSISTWFSSFK